MDAVGSRRAVEPRGRARVGEFPRCVRSPHRRSAWAWRVGIRADLRAAHVKNAEIHLEIMRDASPRVTVKAAARARAFSTYR